MSRHQLLSPLTLAVAIAALSACSNPTGPQTPTRLREAQPGDRRGGGGGKGADDTVTVHFREVEAGDNRGGGKRADDTLAVHFSVSRSGDQRRGRGGDDLTKITTASRRGGGADDRAGDDRNGGAKRDRRNGMTIFKDSWRGRGADDAAGDDHGRGGHGADDGPNHG